MISFVLATPVQLEPLRIYMKWDHGALVMKQIQLPIGTIQNECSNSSNLILNRTYSCHGTYMASQKKKT